MNLWVKANNITNEGGPSNTTQYHTKCVGWDRSSKCLCVEMWGHHIVGSKVGTLPTQPLGLHRRRLWSLESSELRQIHALGLHRILYLVSYVIVVAFLMTLLVNEVTNIVMDDWKFGWNPCQLLNMKFDIFCIVNNFVMKPCHGWLKLGWTITWQVTIIAIL